MRSCEDVDATALSYAEIKALSAGDPRIKEKMDLDVEVAKLRIMKADHDSKKYRLQDRLRKFFPENIERNKALLEGLQRDTEILADHPLPEKDFVGMEIKGDVLTDRENAGAALIQACKDYRSENRSKIGSYRGFDLLLRFDAYQSKYELTIHGGASHTIEVSSSLIGNLQRIENALKAIPQQIISTKAELQNLENQVAAAKEELSKPFPQEEALKQKSARLAELNIELNIDGPQRESQGMEQGKDDRVAKRAPSPFLQSPKPGQQKKQKQEAR